MHIPLAQLDKAVVHVEMGVAGRVVTLQGAGRYERRAAGGNRLNIDVADPAGALTIVLEEDAWNGVITPLSDGSGYRLTLNAPP